jgi:hypothetical protein
VLHRQQDVQEAFETDDLPCIAGMPGPRSKVQQGWLNLGLEVLDLGE